MISVLMSTYREPLEYVNLSINSILRQTMGDFELILIADDPSNTVLIEELKRFEKIDRRVVLLVNEENIGLTGSLNRALNHSHGEFVARMDADDISEIDRFEKQIYYLTSNHLDLIGSNVQNIDENGETIHGVTVFPRTNELIIKAAKYNSPIAHPTWFGKREVFEKLNGYQEIDACEDYDFIVRAILHGFNLGNIQETLLRYRINSSGISATKKARQKAALYFIRRNYRNGLITTEKEYMRFINSKRGSEKIDSLNRYYEKTRCYKTIPPKSIKRVIYGIYIVCSSVEAPSAVINLIKERLYVR